MGKVLDLSKNLYTLCEEYPEAKAVMVYLGFSEVAKPMMLNTMGKFMTIPKGAAARSIPLDSIIKAFEAVGFTVETAPE